MTGSTPLRHLTRERVHRRTKPRHHRQHPIDLEPASLTGSGNRTGADPDLVRDLLPRHVSRSPLPVEGCIERSGVKSEHY